MKSKFVFFVIYFNLMSFSFANDVALEAKREFDACMKERKLDRERCNFGGCGNITGSCYERRINVFSLATESTVKKLSFGRCKEAANSVSIEIENLNSRFKLLAPFDGTWGGYDVQVEVALLKNKVMNSLLKECGE